MMKRMSASTPEPVTCRRRIVLAAGLAALAAPVVGLSGCGLRLEDDAPQLPRLPGQGPHPSAALLHAELSRCETALVAASAASGRGGPAVAAALVGVHSAQAAALRARLEKIGEDLPPGLAGGAPTSPGTASPRSTASPTPAPVSRAEVDELRRAEAAGTRPAELTDLAAAAASDTTLLCGCRAVRAAASALVGGPAPASTLPPTLASPAQVGALLTAANALVYGLQVATTRVAPARRQVAGAALTWASRLRDSLQVPAGPSAPPAPLGYELPFPVDSPAAADRLAQLVLARFADQVLALARDAAGHGDALSGIVTTTATTEWHRVRWGGAARALPAASS